MRRYFPSLVILLASLAIPACSQAVTADPPEETVEMLFPSPAYGIHTNMWWKPDLIEQDLALVKEMEFDWVKQKFPSLKTTFGTKTSLRATCRILLIFAALSPSATRGALPHTRSGTNQTWAASGVNCIPIRPITRNC
ncbi:MAG: hypothetical protein P8169_15600 [Chloroflexota bacterium]